MIRAAPPNPFTLLVDKKRTLVSCAQQVCQLCEDTFTGEDLKVCRRMQCDLEAYKVDASAEDATASAAADNEEEEEEDDEDE